MASNRRPPTPPHVAGPAVKEKEEELPLVECVGFTRMERGWVVVLVTVQGDKVVDRTVISKSPEPRVDSGRRAINEAFKLFLSPPKDVSA